MLKGWCGQPPICEGWWGQPPIYEGWWEQPPIYEGWWGQPPIHEGWWGQLLLLMLQPPFRQVGVVGKAFEQVPAPYYYLLPT